MNKFRQSAPHLACIKPYDPKYIPAKIMNSANENPLDVPAHIKRCMMDAAQRVQFNRYPEPLANDLREAIAEGENELLNSVQPEQMFALLDSLQSNNATGGNDGAGAGDVEIKGVERKKSDCTNAGDGESTSSGVSKGVECKNDGRGSAGDVECEGEARENNTRNTPQSFQLTRDNVLIGNGGDELLFNLALTWGGSGRTFLNVPPTFSVYEGNAQLLGTSVINISRRADFSLDETAIMERASAGDVDYIILTSPNNPTGDLVRPEFVDRLLGATDALVMVDEAYFEFSRQTVLPLLARHKNLIILRTFSKAFSLAGVRVGYVLAHAEVVREFLRVRQPYSVDAISQEIAKVAYEHREEFYASALVITKERKRLFEELQRLGQNIGGKACGGLGSLENDFASDAQTPGSWNIDPCRTSPCLKVFPSHANYLLCRVTHADIVWKKLFDAGILVRDFSHAKGLEDCLRISVGTREENDALLRELEKILR